MKLHHHITYSAIISGILYLAFKSWSMAAACFIAGIFIDLDHIIDYTREHGWPLNIRNFFSTNHKCQYNRILLLGHGWEWIILWGIATWLSDWNPWMTGAFIGISQHMILDTFYNGSNFWCYSILWRWKRKFDFDTIFPKLKSIKYKYR